MTEFCSPISLPYIPDDLTVPQFLLDEYRHPLSEMRKEIDDVWFIDDATGKRHTFGELKTRSSSLALGLASSQNITKDEVVLFFSPNSADFVVATWAFHRLGAIVATSNPMYTAEELVNLLQVCKATRIVADERFLPTVTAAATTVGISSDAILLFASSNTPNGITISQLVAEGQESLREVPDLKLAPGEGKTKAALIFFSSGTTGKPKAVALSHYNVLANIIQMSALQRDNGKSRGPAQYSLIAEDVVTGILPMFHVYGIIFNVYWACFLGLIVDIFPRFSLSNFLESITTYRINHLYLVPPHVVLICKDPSVASRDYSHVKSIFTGGASLSVPLMHKTIELFPNASIAQGYGMSELIIASLQSPLQRLSDGSCGPMLPGFVAKVVKADGSYAVAGETGELIMTSPSVGLGYIGDEEATKSTFIHGWIRSGDEVRFNDEGDLFIVDRIKELIKVRGFQVAPAEIEDHLMSHPYVADVCVVAIPDEYSGELPLAFVVPTVAAKKLLEDGKDEMEIKAEIQKHVSDHKVKDKWLAGGVRFVDTVPKSPSGKILRRLLRDTLRASDSLLVSAPA